MIDAISDYALGYILSILITAFGYGYRRKTVDIARNSDRHRTSISRFLRYEKWDDSALEKAMRDVVINIIYEESRRSGMPILFIVDDTISSKSMPSSKASHPIEAASFHFSHLKKKRDYGHQAVSVMLSCINSPSKITKGYGEYLAQGLSIGFDDYAPKTLSSMVYDSICSSISD